MRHAIGHNPDINNPASSSNESLLLTVAQHVRSARRIVVITGAGISTSAGISDFRGDHSATRAVTKDLLNARTLRQSRDKFFQEFVRIRKPMLKAEPTPTHQFLRDLRDRRRLVRVYSQNIDGLEAKAGLSTLDSDPIPTHKTVKKTRRSGRGPECVLLHGCISHLRCEFCSTRVIWDRDSSRGNNSRLRQCRLCKHALKERRRCGKRVAAGTTSPFLRPDVWLYDEPPPPSYFSPDSTNASEMARIQKTDLRRRPDLVLVLGTSLSIPGVKQLLNQFSYAATGAGGKVVMVNYTRPPKGCEQYIDCWIQWSCDEWVRDLARCDSICNKASQGELAQLLDTGLLNGEDDGRGDEWYAERLADEKEGPSGAPLYLVAWSGYPPDQWTWEPEENIGSALLENWKSRSSNTVVVE